MAVRPEHGNENEAGNSGGGLSRRGLIFGGGTVAAATAWAPVRRACSPSCDCPPSPSSTRPCPTGRCSSTREGSARWGLQHADFATPDQLARLKALSCAVSVSGFRWLGGVPRADGLPVGPLYPQILASGIPMGMHEDGVHISPHNPWFALHYATTGLNVLGQQINPGQQITRQQALHAYTRDNACTTPAP